MSTSTMTPEQWIAAQGFARCARCEESRLPEQMGEHGVCALCLHREARAPYVGAIEDAREAFASACIALDDAIQGGAVTPDPEEWSADIDAANAAFDAAKAEYIAAMGALAAWDACNPRP